jgi:hypothetical protein
VDRRELHGALVLDENASEEQRAALATIYGGELGDDAANLAALIGDMKGAFTAPIEYSATAGEVSFKAGDTAEGAGGTLKNVDGTAEIQVTNAHYPLPTVTAGRSTKVKANVPGVEQQILRHGRLLVSRAAPVAALHLVSGAGQRFSTWNYSPRSETVA